MRAGSLKERIAIQARSVVDDGYGNTVSGPFADVFTVWAGYTYLRGTEAVMAARLESRQPVVVRVRASSQTKTITNDHRVRDTRSGEFLNIRVVTPDVDGAFIDLLCEAGVAT